MQHYDTQRDGHINIGTFRDLLSQFNIKLVQVRHTKSSRIALVIVPIFLIFWDISVSWLHVSRPQKNVLQISEPSLIALQLSTTSCSN